MDQTWPWHGPVNCTLYWHIDRTNMSQSWKCQSFSWLWRRSRRLYLRLDWRKRLHHEMVLSKEETKIHIRQESLLNMLESIPTGGKLIKVSCTKLLGLIPLKKKYYFYLNKWRVLYGWMYALWCNPNWVIFNCVGYEDM